MSGESIPRRYPPRPLIGVGAVVFDGPRVLLIERGQEPLKGWWTLPGGLVEAGERLDQALRREVLEETGLIVEPLTVAAIFERIIKDDSGRAEYHYVIIDYLCRRAGGELRWGSDVADARWVALGDIPSLQVAPGTPPVIEKALAIWREWSE
ncbi:MAG: NUDIX hydrolase [Bryobacteraceae bacterium]|nr:NUDIX hydrolase [Bryobacteraceae bacterium]MCX7602534.1 NUDIX hydrolase [Bryobacteraceae bacterium]